MKKKYLVQLVRQLNKVYEFLRHILSTSWMKKKSKTPRKPKPPLQTSKIKYLRGFSSRMTQTLSGTTSKDPVKVFSLVLI